MSPRRPRRKSLHELAESIDADLIVVGSTARGPIGRALAGTTAERLLHGGPCAVAIAPRGFRETERPGLHRIGVAYCTDPDSSAALAVAHEIARATGGLLDVISVFDRPAYENVRLRPGELGDYVDGTPEEVLVKRAATLDLLVMGSRT